MVTTLPGANGLIAPTNVDLELRKERDLALTLNPWVLELTANHLEHLPRANHAKSRIALLTADTLPGANGLIAPKHVDLELRKERDLAPTLNPRVLELTANHLDRPPKANRAKSRNALLTVGTLLGDPVQTAAMEDGDLEHVTTQDPNTEERHVRELPRRNVTPTVALRAARTRTGGQVSTRRDGLLAVEPNTT